MARGGKREPARPAPVSGPGAQSQRTDGGAGSKSQPLRAATGGEYGSRKATLDQQKSAPLASGPGPTPAGPASGGAGAALPGMGGVFGPTERPGEDPGTGAGGVGGMVAQDVNGFIQILYSKFPHPAIGSLMQKDM